MYVSMFFKSDSNHSEKKSILGVHFKIFDDHLKE